jgi:hypothetical protein
LRFESILYIKFGFHTVKTERYTRNHKEIYSELIENGIFVRYLTLFEVKSFKHFSLWVIFHNTCICINNCSGKIDKANDLKIFKQVIDPDLHQVVHESYFSQFI